MCGIAGFFGDTKGIDSIQILRSMLTRIRHRGPDESGVYVSNKVALGSVRLSIIDLKSGTMPLSNSDDTIWIVFNGEIFNYIELREELIAKGYIFKTNTDTEVIVHMYEEFGMHFLNKLNGQFAIAIWDKTKEELILARDRVGIRPLYFTKFNGFFIFGSEIKSLIEFPNINLEISPKAVSEYFTFWSSISPNTFFEDVYEVTPGTYVTINSKEINRYTYWELPISRQNEYRHNNLEKAVDEFERLFSDSVKLRMRADVPVAAYLSGGIDSSVTTSFIKEISSDNLETFSIGFSDKDYDESHYQILASKYFKTKHTSFTCNNKEIAEDFKDVVWHSEAPLLRTAPAPMSILAKNVRQNNIKVVITGEGADELLGGYNIFKETKIRQFWAKDEQSKLRPLLLKKLYPYLPQMKNASNGVLKMFFGYKLNETESPFYSHLLRWNNTGRIKNYFSDNFKEKIADYDPLVELTKKWSDKLSGYDFLSKAQWIEIKLFMSGYLLSSQGDRMAMANSVEGRYPFLDHRIIEFCMSLSPDLKLKGLNEKFLLKKLIKNRIPEPILYRSKQAYRAPIRNVFVSDDTPNSIKEVISEEALKEVGVFNPIFFQKLMTRMQTKDQVSEIDNMALTGIVSVQMLFYLFVKKTKGKLNKSDLLELDKIITD